MPDPAVTVTAAAYERWRGLPVCHRGSLLGMEDSDLDAVMHRAIVVALCRAVCLHIPHCGCRMTQERNRSAVRRGARRRLASSTKSEELGVTAWRSLLSTAHSASGCSGAGSGGHAPSRTNVFAPPTMAMRTATSQARHTHRHNATDELFQLSALKNLKLVTF